MPILTLCGRRVFKAPTAVCVAGSGARACAEAMAPLRAVVGELGLPGLSRSAPALAEQVLRTVLWHLDRIADHQPRLDRAGAIAQVVDDFRGAWQIETQGWEEHFVLLQGLGDLAQLRSVAQAKQVLRVALALVVAGGSLAGAEDFETFAAQTAQQFGSGDVGIAGAAAVVLFIGKHRRGNGANLVIRQRRGAGLCEGRAVSEAETGGAGGGGVHAEAPGSAGQSGPVSVSRFAMSLS